MAQKKKPMLIALGDVLKTHPFEGYWGCALTLTAREKIDRFDPFCHIGITSAVFTHDYDFLELEPSKLELLEIDREIRVAPNTHAPLRRETCIGIYSRRLNPSVNVIGNIDVSLIASKPLTFDIGNGRDGGWPHCGPVSRSLGYDAIHAWRAVHDRSRWLAEMEAARKSHEEMLIRLKEQDRQKRTNAKERKRLPPP